MYIIGDELIKTEVTPYKFDIKNIHKENLDYLVHSFELYSSLLSKASSIPDLDDTIILEIKDKSVLKWVTTFQAPSKYSKTFVRLLNSLDKLPTSVKFIYIEEPVAIQYATEYDYNSLKEKPSTSMDELLLLDDD